MNHTADRFRARTRETDERDGRSDRNSHKGVPGKPPLQGRDVAEQIMERSVGQDVVNDAHGASLVILEEDLRGFGNEKPMERDGHRYFHLRVCEEDSYERTHR